MGSKSISFPKFFNGDFSIRYNGTFAQVRQDLRKLLALSLEGRSDYAVYETPNGKLAFRLTDHNANGNNFEQDEANINLSVYVAFEEFDHIECSIHYKEYRITPEIFDTNREICINAIIKGVYNALEGGEFEIDDSIAQMTEYNKPIPNTKENNQENINCNRNMNKNRIRLTESQLHKVIKESVKRVLNEYKNKDTERFNTTGKKYDDEAVEKHLNRNKNQFHDGADRYQYHNNAVAKDLAVHGRGQQYYDEWDRDEDSYYDLADDQWIHDHPVDPRGYLYQRDAIPTFDGCIERGTFSDL